MKRISTLLLATLLAISCAGGRSCAGVMRGDTFVWQNYTEPPTLDPALSEDTASAAIIYQLFEGLTEYDPKTLEPIPALATRWELSPDGRTYTFHLRSDAKWSDGSAVTAADFEYAWKRLLDPKTASRYTSMFYFIDQAEEYATGKILNADTVGVRATNPTTLEVRLKDPTPFFIQLTALLNYRPTHRATVEQWGDAWTRPEHMVTNGAYKLVGWIPQKEVLLEKNPFYWDAKNVHIQKVKFLAVEDRETALKLHFNGEVNYSMDLPHLKIPELSTRPDFQKAIEWNTYYYQINTTKKPFDDVRVRRALNMAIDKKQLVEFMKKGDFPATHLTPSAVKGYDSPDGDHFDPVKAKGLLAEAGFSDPKTFPKVTISYNTSEGHKAIAELIQNMWKTNLGIEVDILNLEWKTALDHYKAKEYDIGRMAWQGDYMDPYTFLEIMTSNSTQNRTGWANPTYDDLLLVQSAKERDPAKRFAILKKAEEILNQEVPIIPIYFYVRPALVDPRLKGFYMNARDIHPLRFASFE